MSRLPFVVQPRLKPIVERIGTEETGILEIERRGFLSAGEKAFLQQSQTGDDTSVKMLALVRKVSKDLKIGLEAAHKGVINVLSGQTDGGHEAKIASKYTDDIENIMTLAMSTESRRVLSQAACMLMYRVDPDLEIEEIMKLHPDLLQALAELCLDEENKSTERLQDTYQDKEEAPDVDSYEALEKK